MKAVTYLQNFRGFRHFILFIYLLLSSQFVIATNAPETASAYYENALKHYNNAQYDEAVIQLKNAFRENPRLLPALVLLGKTYLETGNPAAAEAALKNAIELGADLSLVIIPLSNAYLKQFKHDLLLTDSVPDTLPQDIKSKLHLLRARAAFEINNRSALNNSIVEAERFSPMDPDLLALKATLSMRSGALDKAQEIISRLESLYPEAPNTWLTDASLKHIQGNLAGALDSYKKVISLSPGNNDARIARIGLMMDLNRHTETVADLTELDKSIPFDPRVSYLRGVLLAHTGDHQGSIAALNEALNTLDALGSKIVTRNLQLLMVAAIANYSLNKFESARNYLEIYVNSSANELAPHQLLASIYMHQGEYRNAINLLKIMLETFPDNPNILAMLAQAYDSAGNHQLSIITFEKALKQKGHDQNLKTQLAISKMNAGQIEQGLSDLKKLFNNDQTQASISLSLAISLLIQREFDSAVKVARKLVESEPTNLAKQNLLAIALTSIGNHAEAKELFKSILIAAPDSSSVKMNLAKIERLDGNIENAQLLLNQLLKEKGQRPEIMLEMARLSTAQGDRVGALRWAKDAANTAPKSFSINSYLIDLLLENDDVDQALKVALDQEAVHPDNLHVLESQVKVLRATQKTVQLLSLLRRMATLAEFNTQWLLKIANYQIEAESIQEASYTLFRGLQGNPQHFETLVLLADVETRLGRLNNAMDHAKQLITDHPMAHEGYLLAGNIHMARNQFKNAANSYFEALKYDRNAFLILRLHIAQRYLNQKTTAKTTLLDWLTLHPEDLLVKNALAEFYLSVDDYAQAHRIYLQLLAQNSNSPYLHNNMAYSLFKLKQTEKAIEYARHAYSLASEESLINDTLGWLLVNNSNPAEGLPFLREALTREPGDVEIRYHLAVALFKLGRRSEARRELLIALEPEINFNDYTEATQLLEELNNES